MNKYKYFLAFFVLIFTSLACQTVTGSAGGGSGGFDSNNGNNNEQQSNTNVKTDFPLAPDASNITEIDGDINYQTSLSVDEVLKFYRDHYATVGYTEREILTDVYNGTFSIVFDGDPSGQSVIIQGFEMGNGTTNVNIRLESIN